MEILVLGGTIFLGRHFVEAALERGHQLTLFNRGLHNPHLFPGVEKLIGDRDGNLNALRARKWDAVLDTSGNVPRIVKAAADLLAPSVGHYTFISSISVYQEEGLNSIDEESPIRTLADEDVEEITGETYGALKALSEKAVVKSMPGRVLIVRPGLIVGPNDPSDRFTYWPWRMARGGEILVPGRKEAPIQLIDVRDLAKWLVESIETGRTGLFNLTGPAAAMSLGSLVDIIHDSVNNDAQLTWVDAEFLLENDVGGWIELPLWLGGNEFDAIMKVSLDRVLKTGLSLRSLEEITKDTLAWVETRPEDYNWRAGMRAEREKYLLSQWRKLGQDKGGQLAKTSL